MLKSGILGESILDESVKVRAMRLDQLHTMQITFREICEGRRPWTALGDFLNYWWVYAKDRRYDLVVDPILEAPANEQYQPAHLHIYSNHAMMSNKRTLYERQG